MVNYNLGKVYKIVCNITGLIYVGSTCESRLCTRLAKHVAEYKTKERNPSKYIFVSSHDILKNGNYDIVLIEECPCKSKDELHRRERYFIETLECVNRIIPRREEGERLSDHREYNNKNRIEINKKNLIHYHENKKVINKKRCRMIMCHCGIEYTKSNITYHMKSKRHIHYHQLELMKIIKKGCELEKVVRSLNERFEIAHNEYKHMIIRH